MSREDNAEKSSYEIDAEQARKSARAALDHGGEEPKEWPSKGRLLQSHTNNLNLISSSKTALKQEFMLPTAYAPSILALKDLQKLSISSVRLETHHRGNVIVAKTISVPYQSSSTIFSIIEDDSAVCKLSLNYHNPPGTESALPRGSTVAIKEPYVQYLGDSDFQIRVDHPSDVIVFKGGDQIMEMMMQLVGQQGSVEAEEWAKAGDRAYLQKNYSSAIECYTQAIEGTSSDDLVTTRAFKRKRAYANLTEKRYAAARDDALESRSPGETSVNESKAYYCAGRAAYELGAYADSKLYLSKAKSIWPKTATYGYELRANDRILEQQEGTYDFDKMFASVNKTNIHLDHADYLENVKIGKSIYGGRGLLASRFIKAGDLVLVEKAFVLPNLYDDSGPNEGFVMWNVNNNGLSRRTHSELFIQLVQKLYNDPIPNDKFWNLDSSQYHRSGKEGEFIDGSPVVDVFLVEAIRLRNCFSSPRISQITLEGNQASKTGNFATGLWRQAAYLNHACVPNCTRSFIGNMMLIRAARDIEIDEELTHQYIVPDAAYASRQGIFENNWNFTCTCGLCATEQLSSEESHKARMAAVKQLKEAVLNVKVSKMNLSTIRRVERLSRKLEGIHEESVYGNIPRLLLIHSSIWIMEAYRSARNPVKTLVWCCEVLRNFGFVKPIRDGRLVLEGGGITNGETLHALRYAIQAYKELGMEDLAGQCFRVLKLKYVVLTGTEIGFEEYAARRVDFVTYR